MKSGIYQIRNTVTGRVYIGKSTDIEKRWLQHRYELQSGRHVNKALQQDWNEYGKTCFEFTVLEYIRKNGRIGAAEVRWVARKMDETEVYNSLTPFTTIQYVREHLRVQAQS